MPDGTVEYPRSRPKAIAQIATGSFLAITGGLLAFVVPPEWVEVGIVSTTSDVFGWLALLVSPLSLVQGARHLRDQGPGLRITEEGLDDRSSLQAPGFVSWTDVLALQPARFFLVGVTVRDWTRRRRALSLVQRLIPGFMGSDFYISSVGIGASRAELLAVLRERWRRARPAPSADPAEPAPRVYRESWKRPARALATVATVLLIVWVMFALGMARFLDAWEPVDWLPLRLPTWVGTVAVALVGGVFVGDASWRLRSPLRIELGEDGLRYRGITLPWSSLEGAYPLARERVAVLVREGQVPSDLPAPVSILLRSMRRLKGAELIVPTTGFDVDAAELAHRINRRAALEPPDDGSPSVPAETGSPQLPPAPDPAPAAPPTTTSTPANPPASGRLS